MKLQNTLLMLALSLPFSVSANMFSIKVYDTNSRQIQGADPKYNIGKNIGSELGGKEKYLSGILSDIRFSYQPDLSYEEKVKFLVDNWVIEQPNPFQLRSNKEQYLNTYNQYINKAKSIINEINSSIDLFTEDKIFEIRSASISAYNFDKQELTLDEMRNTSLEENQWSEMRKTEYEKEHAFCNNGNVLNFLDGAISAKIPSCNKAYISLPAELAEKLFYENFGMDYLIIKSFSFKNTKDMDKCNAVTQYGVRLGPPCFNAEFEKASFKVFKIVEESFKQKLQFVYETPINFK